MEKIIELCDAGCDECPIIHHPNSCMVTRILNVLYKKFGEEVYSVVQEHCPNLTCCYDCRIDDFCHMEGCLLADEPLKVRHDFSVDGRGIYLREKT